MITADNALVRWLDRQWSVEATTASVTVEGAAIAYRGWNLDATDLPGLLLVHGFRAHARWWDHIAPSLARTHRVAAIDLSGMGDSDARSAYSRAQHGREMLAVAADCGFEPVTLVSHSFGTLGAISAAISAPDRLRRLVIIDSALPTPDDVDHQIPVLPRRLYPTREAAVARFRLIPPGAWPNAEILAYIARHSVRETAEGWGWKFDEQAAVSLNAEARAYREGLSGVRVPTDVLYGAESEVVTLPRRVASPQLLPLAGPLIEIPCAHHHVMIERPLALVAALEAVLAHPRERDDRD